jgi:DNA-binding IclR family transcriptional regulator
LKENAVAQVQKDRASHYAEEFTESSARIASVQRALQVLELLAGRSEGMPVNEAAERLRVTKGVASRILGTIEAEGYVRQDPDTQRYHLAFKLIALAYNHADAVSFPDFCQPVLCRLVRLTGEMAQLALVGPEGTGLYATEDCEQEVRVSSRISRPLPLHSSAAFKVFLASLPEEDAREIISRVDMVQMTNRTITSVEAYLEELRRVRTMGYATNEGERILEVNVVAVPVRDRKGQVEAAVMLKGPASRLTLDKMKNFVPWLKEAAAELSQIWPRQQLW